MNSRRRLLVIAGCGLAHAVLLVLLLRAPAGAVHAADPGLMAVSLYNGSAMAAPTAPAHSSPAKTIALASGARTKPKFAQPTDVAPQFIDVSASQPNLSERDPLQDPVAFSVAAASGVAGQACQLGAWLQSALQTDPQVQAALLAIPRPARSISNALMLWNGGWVEVQVSAAAGVAAIRAAVLSGVRAAPESCRTQLERGPELMTLTSGGDTTVIAIGSGEWRWDDLLAGASDLTLIGSASPVR